MNLKNKNSLWITQYNSQWAEKVGQAAIDM